MNIKYFIILISIWLLTSCEKREILETPYGDFIEYIIEKDNHYCNGNHINYISTPYIYKEFMLDSTCLYDLSYSTAWNKLVGFVSDLNNPQVNSVRIAWRPSSKGGFDLAAYYHTSKNKTPIIHILYKNIYPNDIGWCECYWRDNYYYVNINGLIDSCYQDNKPNIMYMNYPYFGGDTPAPQTMKIYLK